MSAPKERPILFSAPMVNAILDGTKTQTRRIVSMKLMRGEGAHYNCPYGNIKDRLWVRETWARYNIDQDSNDIAYRATTPNDWPKDGIWKPSIHMPRHASRINLEITRIRIERLQDISEEDAIAEGVRRTDEYTGCADDIESHRHAYKFLWESLNGKGSWDLNPWVWVVEFERLST